MSDSTSNVPRETLDKPYVDAGAVARLLSVDRAVVEADVRAGMAGALGHLSGMAEGGICVVEAWDLTDERIAYHRERFATGVRS